MADPSLVLFRDAAGGLVEASAANPLPMAGGASESHTGAVGGHTARVSANFSRPADTTAYASGDLVANSTTAGSVTP